MAKINVNELLRREERAKIPFVREDGTEDVIIIKNPTEELKRQTFQNFSDGKSEDEILKFLFDELTNIELSESLDELKQKDLSYELECVFYHMTCIVNEIIATIQMEANVKLLENLNNDLSEKINEKVAKAKKNKLN